MTIELVYASEETVAKAYPVRPPQTMRGIIAMEGERVLGIAGVYRQDANLVLFANLTDELRQNKRTIIKAIRLLKKLIARAAMPVVATADPEIDGSDRLLQHMGFEPREGGLYVWHS